MPIVGHGIDLVQTSRIIDLCERYDDEQLLRIFTQEELDYASKSNKRSHEHLAARFAAKEAALKALGTGWRYGIAWTDVSVTRDEAGKPELIITGKAAELAKEKGITHWHLSLTHTEDSAMASVIAEAL